MKSSALKMVDSVASQHSDQASFLWGLRASAVAAPHYSLADLTKLDQRVEAHIDGLRIAGEEGWRLCAKELAWEEAGEVFAAAVLALETGDNEKIKLVLNAAAKTPELARGFISALGWLDYHQAEPCIITLCASRSPAQRRIGIAAAAIHRKDPGRALNDAVSDPDLLLRARAIRAAGELGRVDLVGVIQRELTAEDVHCRFWAAWSTALLAGYENAIELLQTLAESASPYGERALQTALRRMNLPNARRWQQSLTSNPRTSRLAIIAAGAIGDPFAISWLIEEMKIPPLARVAGESFTTITGVDIAHENLDTGKPGGFESGPTENPEDDDVEMDPDERLPWPDPTLVAKWWNQHQAEFQTGVRHLLAKPISGEWSQHVLRIGRQRQRAAAALELASMRPGTPLFEVRAPGFRQQQALRLKPKIN